MNEWSEWFGLPVYIEDWMPGKIITVHHAQASGGRCEGKPFPHIDASQAGWDYLKEEFGESSLDRRT